MFFNLALALTAAFPFGALSQTLSNETVLGVYIFHRHGDRTAKSTPPANLTLLGYQEVLSSGQYYRGRYITPNAPYRINRISSDIVLQSQIAVSAPLDTVLQNSATAFLQGLYPPVAQGSEKLRNGTIISSPMDGYQLIPVELVTSGTGSEDNGWLQSASGCHGAIVSSNNYFLSEGYTQLLNSTQSFYQGLANTTNGVFTPSQVSYKNAYAIFDLIHVAEIHNSTIPASDLLTEPTLFQLRTLADTHEWNLAYNASDNLRAISGMTLAAQIVQAFNSTLTSKGTKPLTIQFGAYATFFSFFGLAIPDMDAVNPDLFGIADYASAMSFELFTNGSVGSGARYPAADDVYVRFLFHNGTASNTSTPVAYPLFGSGQEALRWTDFQNNMNKFAIGTTQQWCTACGNFTGTCAAYAPSSSSGAASSSTAAGSGCDGGNGLSPAVNGVIGAMVTLAVVLGVEAVVMLAFGLRILRKKRANTAATETVDSGKTA